MKKLDIHSLGNREIKKLKNLQTIIKYEDPFNYTILVCGDGIEPPGE